MKTLLSITLVSLLLSGCATTPGSTNRMPLIKTAAYLGTANILVEHPEWRGHFINASSDLALLEAQDNIDFTTVLAIVNRLPIKELKSKEARIIITSATILLSEFNGPALSLDNERVKQVIVALREGIDLGLH